MQREQIIFVGTSDLSGHFRGKSFPAADLPSRLQRGVGLAPSNLFLSAFGPIQSTPFGTRGEVYLVPDPSTRVLVQFEDGAAEHFYIGDIRGADGNPWDFCPRHALRRAHDLLERETGVRLYATFEQEFLYSGVAAHPLQPYALDALRRQGIYGEALLAAMRQVGVVPDSFLAEFGAQQYEVTCAPAVGVRAADDAVITRELAQAVAFRLGERVSFTPLPEPNATSSGTHIHWSLLGPHDEPVLHDAAGPLGLSALGTQFVAGILHHLPGLCALSAPSVPSYYRLRPNGWAPAYADFGVADRGTALRICTTPDGDDVQRARQFNVEFRVADATASPYIALAALIHAGLDGVRRRREIVDSGRIPLPGSLAAALELLEAGPAASWFGAEWLSAYIRFKRAELQSLDQYDEKEICRRYAEAY